MYVAPPPHLVDKKFGIVMLDHDTHSHKEVIFGVDLAGNPYTDYVCAYIS